MLPMTGPEKRTPEQRAFKGAAPSLWGAGGTLPRAALNCEPVSTCSLGASCAVSVESSVRPRGHPSGGRWRQTRCYLHSSPSMPECREEKLWGLGNATFQKMPSRAAGPESHPRRATDTRAHPAGAGPRRRTAAGVGSLQRAPAGQRQPGCP